MKPHKHARLIKAWADGAEIEMLTRDGWSTVHNTPSWWKHIKYRIKPDCEYVYQKVFELGGDDAVVLYEQFLKDASQIEIFDTFCEVEKWRTMEPPAEYPLSAFTLDWTRFYGKIRKKKQTVTEVLWICDPLIEDVPTRLTQQWVPEGSFPIRTCVTKNHDWHKVPTLTREVEV